MWSHYGSRHTGVALQFEFSRKDYGSILLPVIYHKKNVRGSVFQVKEMLDIFQNPDNMEASKNITKKLLLTKHSDWGYEREWRIITFCEKTAYMKINQSKIIENKLTGVYLGLNISEDLKKQLIDIVNKKYFGCKIYIPIKCKKNISLEFSEIKV